MDLITAVENKELATVNTLLSNGWDVDTTDQHGKSALVVAAATGSTEIVDTLLEHGATVDLTDKYRYSALMRAACRGYTNIVHSLLEHGADTEIKCNAQGYTALMKASHEGHLPVVEMLIEKGADVNATATKSCVTALLRAAMKGHDAVVSALLDAGADCNIPCKEDYTPLLKAVQGQHEIILDLLLQKGHPDLTFSEFDPLHPITLAENGPQGERQLKIILALLNAGVKPPRNHTNGDSYLMKAVTESQHEIVEALLRQKDCEVDFANADGEIALIRAAKLGNLTSAAALLSSHANIDARDEYGDTPLICAADQGHTDVVKYLVEQGADINAAAEHGHTALIVAAISGRTNIVRYLLDEGANIDNQTVDGFTALIEATKNGHVDTIDLLIRRQCNADLRTVEGSTALSYAELPGSKCPYAVVLMLRDCTVDTLQATVADHPQTNKADVFPSSDGDSSDDASSLKVLSDSDSSASNGSDVFLCASSSFLDSDDTCRPNDSCTKESVQTQAHIDTQQDTTTTTTSTATATGATNILNTDINNEAEDTYTATAAADYNCAEYLRAHQYATELCTPGVNVLQKQQDTHTQTLAGDAGLYTGEVRDKRGLKHTHLAPKAVHDVGGDVQAWSDSEKVRVSHATAAVALQTSDEPDATSGRETKHVAGTTLPTATAVTSGAYTPTTPELKCETNTIALSHTTSGEPLLGHCAAVVSDDECVTQGGDSARSANDCVGIGLGVDSGEGEPLGNDQSASVIDSHVRAVDGSVNHGAAVSAGVTTSTERGWCGAGGAVESEERVSGINTHEGSSDNPSAGVAENTAEGGSDELNFGDSTEEVGHTIEDSHSGVAGIDALSEAELLTLQRMLYGTDLDTANPGTTTTSVEEETHRYTCAKPGADEAGVILPVDGEKPSTLSAEVGRLSVDTSGASNETIGTSTTPSEPSEPSLDTLGASAGRHTDHKKNRTDGKTKAPPTDGTGNATPHAAGSPRKNVTFIVGHDATDADHPEM